MVKRKSKSMMNRKFRKMNRRTIKKGGRRRRKHRTRRQMGGGMLDLFKDMFKKNPAEKEFDSLNAIPKKPPEKKAAEGFFDFLKKPFETVKETAGSIKEDVKQVGNQLQTSAEKLKEMMPNMRNEEKKELDNIVDNIGKDPLKHLTNNLDKMISQFKKMSNWIQEQEKNTSRCPCCKKKYDKPIEQNQLPPVQQKSNTMIAAGQPNKVVPNAAIAPATATDAATTPATNAATAPATAPATNAATAPATNAATASATNAAEVEIKLDDSVLGKGKDNSALASAAGLAPGPTVGGKKKKKQRRKHSKKSRKKK